MRNACESLFWILYEPIVKNNETQNKIEELKQNVNVIPTPLATDYQTTRLKIILSDHSLKTKYLDFKIDS